MKYKDFEGTIQALVDRKLDEIEAGPGALPPPTVIMMSGLYM